MNNIEQFCDEHGACDAGREWALQNCEDMHAVWNTIEPEWLVWVATRPGVLSDSEQRLFACWCVRQVWHLLNDERSKRAVEVAERFAVGDADEDELAAAKVAALDAARAARDAARDAASDARDAARDAAGAAAWAAAWNAAWAAWNAAWNAAWAAWNAGWAAWEDQAAYLREHHQPFARVKA